MIASISDDNPVIAVYPYVTCRVKLPWARAVRAELGENENALSDFGRAIDIRRRLVDGEHPELAGDLASSLSNRGVIRGNLGEPLALCDFAEAIEIFERLVNGGRQELRPKLQLVYAARTRTLTDLGPVVDPPLCQ